MSRVVLRLGVVLAIIFTLIQFGEADQCKKKMKSIIFERCDLRSTRRSKRHGPLLDSFGGYQRDSIPVQEHPANRQIMSIREIFMASRMPIYHAPYPSYPRYDHNPEVPPSDGDIYRVQPPKPDSLPQESHSEVGFEMSYEEMIELFDEFYERMPRGAKTREEMQKEFLLLAEKCCQNIDHCAIKMNCQYS